MRGVETGFDRMGEVKYITKGRQNVRPLQQPYVHLVMKSIQVRGVEFINILRNIRHTVNGNNSSVLLSSLL